MSALAQSWDDLDDDLSEIPTDIEPDTLDPTMAERMLRRVLRLRRQYEADVEVAQAQREQVDAWLARRSAATATATGYLEDCLRQFHEARLAADPKAKTIHLPSGTLVARKAPDRVEVDPVVFFAGQPDDSDLVRHTFAPDKPSILQHVKQTGEVPAGVELVPGEVGFTLKGEDQ